MKSSCLLMGILLATAMTSMADEIPNNAKIVAKYYLEADWKTYASRYPDSYDIPDSTFSATRADIEPGYVEWVMTYEKVAAFARGAAEDPTAYAFRQYAFPITIRSRLVGTIVVIPNRWPSGDAFDQVSGDFLPPVLRRADEDSIATEVIRLRQEWSSQDGYSLEVLHFPPELEGPRCLIRTRANDLLALDSAGHEVPFALELTDLKNRINSYCQSRRDTNNEYKEALRSYYEAIEEGRFGKAYDMLSSTELMFRFGGHTAAGYRAREKFDYYAEQWRKIDKLAILEIEGYNWPTQPVGAETIIGIHTYVVILDVTYNQLDALHADKSRTEIVTLIKGSDGKVRILSIRSRL